MTDILVKEKIPDQTIKEFLSLVFDISIDRLILIDEEDLIKITEMDFSDIDCLCVKNEMHGDVSLFLKLFRYEMDNSLFFKSLQTACNKFLITCYVPIDNFDGWLKISGNNESKIVKELYIEEEELYEAGYVRFSE
jgi:hypothetical protein